MMFGKLDKTVGLVSRLQIKQKKYVNKTKKNNHHRIPFLFDFKQTRSQSNISTPPPSVSRLCFRSRPCTCNTQVYMYTHTYTHRPQNGDDIVPLPRSYVYIKRRPRLDEKKRRCSLAFRQRIKTITYVTDSIPVGVYTLYIYVCVCIPFRAPPPHTVLLPSPLIHWVGKAEAGKEFEETTLERHIGDSGQDGSS